VRCELRHAEVRQLDHAAWLEEQVLRLKITVDNAMCMEMGEACDDLAQVRARNCLIQALRMVNKQRIDRPAGYKLQIDRRNPTPMLLRLDGTRPPQAPHDVLMRHTLQYLNLSLRG
jgi:hypothetical protein